MQVGVEGVDTLVVVVMSVFMFIVLIVLFEFVLLLIIIFVFVLVFVFVVLMSVVFFGEFCVDDCPCPKAACSTFISSNSTDAEKSTA